MMTTDMIALRELIDDASKAVDVLFEPTGQMLAHILSIDGQGKRILIACPMSDAEEERQFRIGMPQRLRAMGHKRWVFFCEAWAASYQVGQSMQANPPKGRADRMEIVTFVAEHWQGLRIQAERQIYRATPDGPGRLMPLVWRDPAEFVIAREA